MKRRSMKFDLPKQSLVFFKLKMNASKKNDSKLGYLYLITYVILFKGKILLYALIYNGTEDITHTAILDDYDYYCFLESYMWTELSHQRVQENKIFVNNISSIFPLKTAIWN